MKIGTLIRFYRKSNNLKISQLAEMAGISQSSLSDIENNKNSPTVDTLNKILNALKISLNEFFTVCNEQYSSEYVELIQSAKELTSRDQKTLSEFIKTFKTI